MSNLVLPKCKHSTVYDNGLSCCVFSEHTLLDEHPAHQKFQFEVRGGASLCTAYYVPCTMHCMQPAPLCESHKQFLSGTHCSFRCSKLSNRNRCLYWNYSDIEICDEKILGNIFIVSWLRHPGLGLSLFLNNPLPFWRLRKIAPKILEPTTRCISTSLDYRLSFTALWSQREVQREKLQTVRRPEAATSFGFRFLCRHQTTSN